jgi:hypothetical protein
VAGCATADLPGGAAVVQSPGARLGGLETIGPADKTDYPLIILLAEVLDVLVI